MENNIYLVFMQDNDYNSDKTILGYVNSHEEFIKLYGSEELTPEMDYFGSDSIHYEVAEKGERKTRYTNIVAQRLKKLI